MSNSKVENEQIKKETNNESSKLKNKNLNVLDKNNEENDIEMKNNENIEKDNNSNEIKSD